MTQRIIPFFPEDTILINAYVGVKRDGEFVYYFHSGNPISCHHKDDKKSYEYNIANIVEQGLCRAYEVRDALGIGYKNIQRYCKKYREGGAQAFFAKREPKGDAYRFANTKQKEAQDLLNQGYNAYQIARKLDVAEGTIRYHLKKGTLKKK